MVDDDVDELQQDLRITRIECDEDFRRLLAERLNTRSGYSLREVKRLLTLWQFYFRVLDRTARLTGTASVTRACNLLLLAEIVTRWPAIQARLHRAVGDRRGLQILAAASADELEWARALAKLKLDRPAEAGACKALRDLLSTYDGRAVADLAAELL
jgi:hypothetical protein